MDEQIRSKVRQILVRTGRPTTEKDLLKQLRVRGEARVRARETLEELLSAGDLVRTRTDRIGLPEKMNLVAGRLETKPGGFGFVRPEAEGGPDVFVGGAAMGEALHGDRVLVRIERRGREGKPEGRIVRVLERATSRLVGRFEGDGGAGRVVPFDPRLLYEIVIPRAETGGAQPGEMVVAELTRYPGPFRAPMGRIVQVLGTLDDPGVDVQVIIAKHELPDVFPDEVLDEAERIELEVAERALAGRTDFRSETIVTIDGETARDFDDAVQVEILRNGNYLLGVHIADVAHYVAKGTRLDQEAYHRGNSVYFPDRAVPMLPERLSNGICSLNPKVDRLVQSVRIELTPTGKVVGQSFHDGVMRSAARMTYTEVRQILVDRDPEVRRRYEHLVPLFERMLALFQILNARRVKRGSIDFDLPEPEILLDVEGVMTGVIVAERNVAHRIIEEFMLLANEVVARYLAHLEAPSLYRVHEPPDEDRVERFEELILSLGYRLRASSEQLKPKSFQRLLKKIEGQPEERLVSYAMLRTMKQARYAMENSGHYALATPIYTHFTSPIRRYPDLIVHRLLRDARRRGLPSLEEIEERERKLPEAGSHCSRTERRAEEAERELVDWKKVRFMADKLGDVFHGFITGVASYGLFVELEEYFVEGMVHISTLTDDYYRYDEGTHTLRGETTRKTYQLGERVKVQLVKVDLEKRRIDLALEEVLEKRARPPRPAAREKTRPGGKERAGRSRSKRRHR